MNANAPRTLTRRRSLELLALFPSALWLTACGESTEETGAGGLGGAGGTAGAGGAGGGSSSTGGSTSGGAEWARGGTASMTGDYASPFPSSIASCELAESVTEGPCTEAADQVRKDISEGYTGLPMRLALLVVDASCNPIEGAKVKVWHTQINGSYSGETPNNQMCLMSQSDSSKHYFRGVQTTNVEGLVEFDSCFPGWYPSRTVHIHFTVTVGSNAFTSQLVFEQSLVDEVFADHPEYAPYGAPDTTNASDNVVGNADLASFTLDATKQSDGALLASKVVVVPL